MKPISNWLINILYKTTFKDFFKLQLTPVEKEISKEAVELKYGPTLVNSLVWAILTIPGAIFLDSGTIVLILVPIAMVAGSAWFSISLSVVKAKFANFGNLLTQNILESFIISLLFMLFIGIISLLSGSLEFLQEYNTKPMQTISGVLSVITITRIVYLIIIGSIKYDMNDAMLTGQNESAQQYFTKSMSFTFQVTDLIRNQPEIQTTNYYISDAFSRVFNTAMQTLESKGKPTDKVNELNELVLKVLKNPEMDQNKVWEIFYQALIGFKGLLNPDNNAAMKMGWVDIEVECLKSNKNESDRAKALRYATIFTLIYEIVTDEGEDIFV